MGFASFLPEELADAMIAVFLKAQRACFIDLEDFVDVLLRVLSVGETGLASVKSMMDFDTSSASGELGDSGGRC